MTDYCDKTMHLVAQKIKAACIQAAIDGYQNAAISGLCHDGACEASISAIRMLDLEVLVKNNQEEAMDEI